MSTTRLSSQERRAAIIQSAIQLFAERGFRGTTTKQLACSIGVSEPVLYQHFNTKRDLYHAILEQLATSEGPGLPDFLPNPTDPADDRRVFTMLAHNVVDWHRQNPNYVRLLMMGALEGNEFNELFYQRYAKAFCDQLEQYFAMRIQQGIFRRLDPVIASRAFLWLVVHYSQEVTLFRKAHYSTTDGTIPQDNTIEGLIDIFLKGILA